jgi:hypothetical protein
MIQRATWFQSCRSVALKTFQTKRATFFFPWAGSAQAINAQNSAWKSLRFTVTLFAATA